MKMKITLSEGKPASQEDVRELELALGCSISDSYRRFISKNDGARPQENSFPVGEDNASGIRQFIPVSDILEESQYIDNLPPQTFPIAEDGCGNYVLLDEGKGGQVYFWDHEFEDDNIIKLADTFDAFLTMLEPFDENSIKLEPGQVKSVWVHPDLQKIIDAQKKGES